jgi:hypothetical protein
MRDGNIISQSAPQLYKDHKDDATILTKCYHTKLIDMGSEYTSKLGNILS